MPNRNVHVLMSAAEGDVVRAWLRANKGPQEMLRLLREIGTVSTQAGGRANSQFGTMIKGARQFAGAMLGVGTAFQAAHTAIGAIRAEIEFIRRSRQEAGGTQVTFGRAFARLVKTIPESDAVRDISDQELQNRILRNLSGRTGADIAQLIETAVSKDVGSTLSERADIAFTGARKFPEQELDELKAGISAVLQLRRTFGPENVPVDQAFGFLSSLKSTAVAQDPVQIAKIIEAIDKQAQLLQIRERFAGQPDVVQSRLRELTAETLAFIQVGELGDDVASAVTNTQKQLGQLVERLAVLSAAGDEAADAALQSSSITQIKRFFRENRKEGQRLLGALQLMFGLDLDDELQRQVRSDFLAGKDPSSRVQRRARTREKTLVPVLQGTAPARDSAGQPIVTALDRTRTEISAELKVGNDAVKQLTTQNERLLQNPAMIPFFQDMAVRDAVERARIADQTRGALGQLSDQIEKFGPTFDGGAMETFARQSLLALQTDRVVPTHVLEQARADAEARRRSIVFGRSRQQQRVRRFAPPQFGEPVLSPGEQGRVDALDEFIRKMDELIQSQQLLKQSIDNASPAGGTPVIPPVDVPTATPPQAIPGVRFRTGLSGADRFLGLFE